MFGFIRKIFAWWHEATLGTHLFTWQKGEFVGEDEQGNRYYQEKGRAGAKLNGPTGVKQRRWVIYNGPVEASRVPPEWHGWLHYTFDEPPTVRAPLVRAWEKPHKANMTGTAQAYRPKGSLARPDAAAPAKDTYEAWVPGAANEPGTPAETEETRDRA